MLDIIQTIFAATGDDLTGILDYVNLGVIVIVTVGLIKGWIVPGYIVDQIREDCAKEKAEKDELRNRLDTEVFPQLWKTTDLLAQFAEQKVLKGD